MFGAAFGILGSGLVYAIARIASGGPMVQRTASAPAPLPAPARPTPATPAAPKPSALPIPEPEQRPEPPPPPPPPPPPEDIPHSNVPTPPPISAPAPVQPVPTPPVQVTPAPAPVPIATVPTPLPIPEPVVHDDEPAPPPAAPPAPVDVPSASVPTPTPAPSGPPAGFDPALARKLAPQVAASIKAKQYDYDRALTARFQSAAGITSDRLYGDDTWGALAFYVTGAPRALFKPTSPTPYPWAQQAGGGSPSPSVQVNVGPAAITQVGPMPEDDHGSLSDVATPPQSALNPAGTPPAGFDVAKAKKLAKQVSANLDSKGKASYSRDLLKQFQIAAGLSDDGLYGGGARGALIFFGVPRPAQPFFKPTATAPYPWEAYAKAQGA